MFAVAEVPAFAIEKKEHVILEYSEEVAELVTIFLKRIRVAPKLKERAFTQGGEKPLCRCHAFGPCYRPRSCIDLGAI